MNIYILGVSRRTGVSDNGKGNPYDIARLNTMTPLTSRDNEHNKYVAGGFAGAEIEIAPEAVKQFLDLDFPDFYDVETDSVIRSQGLTTIVTGIKAQ
jgi:hypothetical protein